MEKIVFATNNAHKLKELRQMLAGRFEVLSAADIGCHDDIPETADTLRGNARQKALWIKERYGYDCFADDTGLEVEALGGEPGVYSARYAGPGHDSAANMAKLLRCMEGKENRRARFVTEIVLLRGNTETCVSGIVEGKILREPRGEEGFGYDPVFEPEDCGKSFAQMDADEKNAVSHRGRAVKKLVDHLLNAN